MAKKKLTPRQDEIVRLMKGQPGITPNEIAATLETTPQAVYQHISRLRKNGTLPKGSSTPKRPARSAKPVADKNETSSPAAVPPAISAAVPTLESVLTDEMRTVIADLAEAKAAKEAAAARENELGERKLRLDAVQKALAA